MDLVEKERFGVIVHINGWLSRWVSVLTVHDYMEKWQLASDVVIGTNP